MHSEQRQCHPSERPGMMFAIVNNDSFSVMGCGVTFFFSSSHLFVLLDFLIMSSIVFISSIVIILFENLCSI